MATPATKNNAITITVALFIAHNLVNRGEVIRDVNDPIRGNGSRPGCLATRIGPSWYGGFVCFGNLYLRWQSEAIPVDIDNDHGMLMIHTVQSHARPPASLIGYPSSTVSSSVSTGIQCQRHRPLQTLPLDAQKL